MNRKVDELGRIVIPIEIREKLKIQQGTTLDIKEVRGKIVLQRLKIKECARCGNNIFSSDNYCSNCGKKVEYATRDS